MAELKAIETEYKGYRFRSRLEARWAVFFDALGVAWEYEPEGYEMGEVRYLPDFSVAEWDAFIEVKPVMPEYGDWNKCASLMETSGKSVLIFYGTPGDGSYRVHCPFGYQGDLSELNDCDFVGIVACRKCDGLWLAEYDDTPAGMSLGRHTCGDRGYPFVAGSARERLIAAYDAARGARFEYGESGAGPVRKRLVSPGGVEMDDAPLRPCPRCHAQVSASALPDGTDACFFCLRGETGRVRW